MIISRHPVGPLETNCYHLLCEETGESVIIDPGEFPDEIFRRDERPAVVAVILTHGHFDHIAGVGWVVESTGAPVIIHRLDAPMLEDPHLNGSAFFGMRTAPLRADRLVEDGDIITFGRCSLTVRHTPGHSPGGISLFSEEGGSVFSGDLLFRLSVGRWDLPGGDYRTLIDSIRTILVPLPDEVAVYPGHGESTTIGYERLHNDFLTDA